MRLLLAEDDTNLGSGLHAGLKQAGYAVDWVRDGEMAKIAFVNEQYDAAVLDIGLPKLSGLEVLDQIRAFGISVPVLVLTARDTINDKIIGLDRGADDYMIKPFDLDELHARIRALLRRKADRVLPVLTHGSLELNPASHTVKKDGKIIDVSTRAFTILQTLLENKGRVLSRSRLEEKLYSWKDEVDSNTIEVHIHHLRKKIGIDFIRTIRGVGYIVDILE